MDMTAGAGQVWRPDPGLGGLYVLHVDGQAMADCSVTDRGVPREEQIPNPRRSGLGPAPAPGDALRGDREGRAAPPDGDRRISPLRGGFGASIDDDEGPSGNPVRSYLFPELDASGSLLLEPDERIVTSWKSYEPSIVARRVKDDSFIGTDSIRRVLLRRW